MPMQGTNPHEHRHRPSPHRRRTEVTPDTLALHRAQHGDRDAAARLMGRSTESVRGLQRRAIHRMRTTPAAQAVTA